MPAEDERILQFLSRGNLMGVMMSDDALGPRLVPQSLRRKQLAQSLCGPLSKSLSFDMMLGGDEDVRVASRRWIFVIFQRLAEAAGNEAQKKHISVTTEPARHRLRQCLHAVLWGIH